MIFECFILENYFAFTTCYMNQNILYKDLLFFGLKIVPFISI